MADDQRQKPERYYPKIVEKLESHLLEGLHNWNMDDSFDALGWPWFNYHDMLILFNRLHSANLTIPGIDCGILSDGQWKYCWTIIMDDYEHKFQGQDACSSWFFEPFKELTETLKKDGLLEQAVFSCTVIDCRKSGLTPSKA